MADGEEGQEPAGAPKVLLRLPESLREALRRPLGPVRQDVSSVPRDAPVVAVGDVVAYHLAQAGREPAVAVVDRRTQREPVDPAVAAALLEDDRRHVDVENPAGTLTASLVRAIREALADPESVVIVVRGEEDLAVLPAILAAPEGGCVLYGQPEEGFVQVTVDPETRERAREFLSRMRGDTEALAAILEE